MASTPIDSMPWGQQSSSAAVNPSRVVALLVQHFGVSHEEEPTFADRQLFNQIVGQLTPQPIVYIEGHEQQQDAPSWMYLTNQPVLGTVANLVQPNGHFTVAQSGLYTIPEVISSEVTIGEDGDASHQVDNLVDQSNVELNGQPSTSPESQPVASQTVPEATPAKKRGSSNIWSYPNDDDDYRPEPIADPHNPRHDQRIVERAYRYWTRQSLDFNVPLILDPNLFDKTPLRVKRKKRTSLSAVMSTYKSIKSENTLRKFHFRSLAKREQEEKGVVDPKELRCQVNDYVERRYREAQEGRVYVTGGMMIDWAHEGKAHFDPEGTCTEFTTSEAWLQHFKAKRGISLLDDQEEYRPERVKLPRRRYYRLKGEPEEPQFDEYGFRIHPNDAGEPRVDRGVMARLNAAVIEHYKAAVESGVTVTRQHFTDWGLMVKEQLDPRGMLLFGATETWQQHLRKKHGITLKVEKKKVAEPPQEAVEEVLPPRELPKRKARDAATTRLSKVISAMRGDYIPEEEEPEVQEKVEKPPKQPKPPAVASTKKGRKKLGRPPKPAMPPAFASADKLRTMLRSKLELSPSFSMNPEPPEPMVHEPAPLVVSGFGVIQNVTLNKQMA